MLAKNRPGCYVYKIIIKSDFRKPEAICITNTEIWKRIFPNIF